MTKAFYISLSCFFLVALLDLWTFKSSPAKDSIGKLVEIADQGFVSYRNQYFNDAFLSLLEGDKLSKSDLSLIKDAEESLKRDGVTVLVKDNERYLFWAYNKKDYPNCKSFKKADYKIQICLEFFDHNGHLKDEIYTNYGIEHELVLSEVSDSSQVLWNDNAIEASSPYRSYRVNNLLIIAYLLSIFVLIWQIFAINKIWLYALLLLGRILLTFFNTWQDRFTHSSLSIDLFEFIDYSSLLLSIDMFMAFCVLLGVSKGIGYSENQKNKYTYLISHCVLLSLLLCSHIRLVQYVALSESFNITINDISTINLPEISIFLALILALSGIFIYSISLVQFVKKNLKRSLLYLIFILLIIVCTLEAYLFNLEIQAVYLALFLSCYLILIDLFIDIKQKSVTWVIWWGIFFGMYLSALFFNYDIQKQIRQRQDFLENIYKDVGNSEINKLIQSTVLDSIVENITELMVLPEEAQYHKEDIQYFIDQKYGSTKVVFDVIRKNGESLFNSFPGIEQCIILNEGYIYDHFRNALWTKRSSPDGLEIYAGVVIKEDQIDKFPLLVIKNNNIINFSYNPDQEEIAFLKSMTGNTKTINSKTFIRYRNNDNEIAFSVKRFESLVKPIALFSFLFTSIIAMFILLGMASKYFNIFPQQWPLHLSQFESLNSRIQTALILVILLSFILIAVVTSSFLKSFINSKNSQFLSEKIETVSKDIKSKIRVAETGSEAFAIAENYQDILEKTHDVKLNFINLKIPKIHSSYFAFAYFQNHPNTRAFSSHLNSEEYISYLPFRYGNSLLGYVEIKEASRSVKGFNVYDFLGSIFNVYVFLFLIASVLAIFIAKSITKPLSLLNQKLSALKLGKQNELISWDREDEVGKLISNYNNMVKELENSVKLLAKTERDNAWREMAKQVAHEIKNPLTPMKMYIQHLSKAIKQNPEKATEISNKIAKTLLEQVENLTQIADSFSNFAELPHSANEKIELNTVVELVHNLFRKRDDMEIKLSEPIDPIHVYADKNQLIRILNNLVKNAIESIPKSRKGIIFLKLYLKENNKAIIEVKDNGAGIPLNMYEKVFQPKFTTKDSGSGLGLAIALNMIESMNGRLYFKSQEDLGTSFFIELDIIRQKFDQSTKRITLD